jgi:5-methylcytosine-specific restriction endonuclease McrA
MRQQILKLDQQGQPNAWISPELAITYHAKNLVAWQLGDESHTLFRGGENRVTGSQSRLWTAPIIAVKGESVAMAKRMNRVPTLTNPELFARDRHVCAYCGKRFTESRLTRDHVIPVSRGGKDIWTNVVTACEMDNHKKDDKFLHEVGMELLYVPYAPNRAEHLILKGRRILPVQAEYLAQFIPESSRAHEILKELQNLH